MGAQARLACANDVQGYRGEIEDFARTALVCEQRPVERMRDSALGIGRRFLGCSYTRRPHVDGRLGIPLDMIPVDCAVYPMINDQGNFWRLGSPF